MSLLNYTSINHMIVESSDNWHFVLVDCSSYNPDLSLPLTYYDITLPNYSTSKTIQYTPYQNKIINSTELGLTSFDDYIALPDGLWTIKQWYGTTPDICQEYKFKNYFRIVNTKNAILEKVQAGFDKCDCKEVNKWYSTLQDLELAKYMAENLCDINRAIIIYNGIKNEMQYCKTC